MDKVRPTEGRKIKTTRDHGHARGNPVRTTRFSVFLFGLWVLGGSWAWAQQADPPRNKFEPPDGKVLVFIGQDRPSVDAYVRRFQIVPAGLMAYTSIQEVDGLDQPAPERGAGIQYAKYFLKRYPHTAIQLGLYMVSGLDGVLSGRFDENIRRLGEWIQASRCPVFLRIGYEFDLPDNNYDPVLYQKAFRYIVLRLRQQGVTNVAFVWHSNGYLRGAPPDIMSWYPGDDVVDWFGISYFDCYNQGSMKFIARLAREHGKPFMLAEASAVRVPASLGAAFWDIWFESLFEFVRTQNVKAICYINCDWMIYPMHRHLKWGDARLHKNAVIARRWKQEIQKPMYLQAGADLFSIIGYTP